MLAPDPHLARLLAAERAERLKTDFAAPSEPLRERTARRLIDLGERLLGEHRRPRPAPARPPVSEWTAADWAVAEWQVASVALHDHHPPGPR